MDDIDLRLVQNTTGERPEACSESVYNVMLQCWLYNTRARAGFVEVFNSLSAIYQTLLKLNKYSYYFIIVESNCIIFQTFSIIFASVFQSSCAIILLCHDNVIKTLMRSE